MEAFSLIDPVVSVNACQGQLAESRTFLKPFEGYQYWEIPIFQRNHGAAGADHLFA